MIRRIALVKYRMYILDGRIEREEENSWGVVWCRRAAEKVQ
jgi:hypothetical protein